jgi:hypothetical protein
MVRDVTAEVASACDPFLNAIENAAEAQTLARGRFPTALESGERCRSSGVPRGRWRSHPVV